MFKALLSSSVSVAYANLIHSLSFRLKDICQIEECVHEVQCLSIIETLYLAWYMLMSFEIFLGDQDLAPFYMELNSFLRELGDFLVT